MAPEQFQGRNTFASDQYALGVMVYEWLCGERPFQGNILEIIMQQMHLSPPPLRQKQPTISIALEAIVLKALAKEPEERFENVQSFVDAFWQAHLHGQQKNKGDDHARIGRCFGNYQLIKLLGKGAFAEVYLGEHVHTRTKAAVKILTISLMDKHAERFLLEAQTLATLEHPVV